MKWLWEGEKLLDGRPCSLPGAYAELLAEGIEQWLKEGCRDELRRPTGPDQQPQADA